MVHGDSESHKRALNRGHMVSCECAEEVLSDGSECSSARSELNRIFATTDLDKGAFAARKQVMLVREPAPLYPPLASSSAHGSPPDRCAIRSRAGILRHHGRISHHQGCSGQLATLKERLAEAEQLAYERAQKVIYLKGQTKELTRLTEDLMRRLSLAEAAKEEAERNCGLPLAISPQVDSCCAPAPASATSHSHEPPAFTDQEAHTFTDDMQHTNVIKEMENMMRLNLCHQFVAPGLEAEYCVHQKSLWEEGFRIWSLLAASVLTVGAICIQLQTEDSVLQLCFWTAAAFFALSYIGARIGPRSWLLLAFRHRESLILAMGGAYALGLTLPVIISPSASVVVRRLQNVSAEHALEYDSLLDQNDVGRLQAIIASCSCFVLAWSDLSPLRFLLLSLLGFVLWTARNFRLLRTLQGSVAEVTGQELDDGVVALLASYTVHLSYYTSVWFVGVLVSFNKDKLLRKNFVILWLVQRDRDRQIRALSHEKTQLQSELVAKQRDRQAAPVKFLDEFQGNSWHTGTGARATRVLQFERLRA